MECLFNVSFSEKLMYLKAMSIRRTLYILGIILFIPTSECLTINSTISDLFIKNLTETYGTDGRISITELKLLLRNIHKVPDITDDKLIPATDDGHDHPNSKGASNCSGEKCPPLQVIIYNIYLLYIIFTYIHFWKQPIPYSMYFASWTLKKLTYGCAK